MADPLNYYAKESKRTSGKKAKTDADYERLAEIEFLGGMYLNEEDKPIIPANVFEACLASGAAKMRLKKVLQGALYCEQDAVLSYSGEKDVKKRFNTREGKLTVGVKIQKSRVMRTRPQFNDWSFTTKVCYDEHQLTLSQVKDILTEAGYQGLCDWRPRYGRFTYEIVQ
jgi:hypothetical protein